MALVHVVLGSFVLGNHAASCLASTWSEALPAPHTVIPVSDKLQKAPPYSTHHIKMTACTANTWCCSTILTQLCAPLLHICYGPTSLP
jgi:hypothetical protein